MLTQIMRRAGQVIAFCANSAGAAFVIVASAVAILCAVAVVAFIILEGVALLTGNG